jgi:hypothetical protein
MQCELKERIDHIGRVMIGRGFHVLPISTKSKSPIIQWKNFAEEPLRQWDFGFVNIAFITGKENGYVVVDCDSAESYIGWLKHRRPTPMRIKTRKGMHFYYRHPGEYVMSNSRIQAPEGFLYDIKGDRSYCLMPPSVNKGYQYQICVCRGNIEAKWLMPGKLPVFDMSWRPVTESRPAGIRSGEIRNAQSVLRTIFAVEGERDVKTYHATMVCIDAGLSEAEAMQEVIQWHSTNVSPPWSPTEIATKVRRVYAEKRRGNA